MSSSPHASVLALPEATGSTKSVGPATLYRLPVFRDPRGNLVPLEDGRGLPFRPERVFMVYDVGGEELRGQHAHVRCEQFLIAAAGKVSIGVDDGAQRWDVTLDTPSLGLHLPAMTWGTQYAFSADALLLVIASERYDADDYIHDYQRFRALAIGPLPRGQ